MELSGIFRDNAVFQANEPIRLFGSGNGKGFVEFDGKKYNVISSGDTFVVELEPHAYGGPYELKCEFNGETSLIKNVYVGEVLLLAGQSNLQVTLKDCACGENVEKLSSNNLIRAYTTKRLEENDGLQEEDGWVICKDDNLLKWSSLGYHLANKISNNKKCAVGIVCAYQGASIIHSWLPRALTLSKDLLVDEVELYTKLCPLYLKWNFPSTLYEYQFKKICLYTFGKVIWYQGETDAVSLTSKIYDKLLKALVISWRKDMNSNVRFVIIQIHNLGDNPDKSWKLVQKHQKNAEKYIENVKVIKTYDISETTNIHPVNKLPLANRIFMEEYKE